MPAARNLLSSRPVSAAYRAARLVAARPALRLAAFAVLALVVSWPLLSTAASMNEFRDAHVLSHYETVARDSILRWREAPLWDPYYCGGMYLLGTPQARFVSPSFLLSLVFGEPQGEALTAFAMLVLGLEGTFRYTRARGATAFASLVTAPVFALSGVFAVAPALGWFNFFGFELLPWIGLGVRRAAARDVRGCVLAAGAFAWCVCFGGTYTAPLALVWCAFELGELLVRHRSAGRRGLALGAGTVACAALLSAGLAAVRLWPVGEALLAAPRIIGGAPGNTWADIARLVAMPAETDSQDGTFYIGWLAAPAVLAGLLHRRRLAPALATLLFAWLAAGYALTPSLFAGLRELPVYSVLRYPERFLVLAALAVAVLAARGVSYAEAVLRTRPAVLSRRRATLRVALAVAVTSVLANVGPQTDQHWGRAGARSLSAPPARMDQAFRQARGNRWGLGYYEPMQRGSLSCWEAYPVPQSPLLRGDAPSEERVVDPGAGTVSERAWSPNAVALHTELSRAATVAINQNWHAGWRASGGKVKSEGGLLAVEVEAGSHDVELRFLPRSASGGALASIVAVVAAAVLAWRARRQPRVRDARDLAGIAMLVVAPAVPAALAWVTLQEPQAAPALVTPDGRPIVADALDEGAVRLDATLEDGVVLEAATLSGGEPVAGGDMTLELDWRRSARVPQGVGVFVHLEPSSGDGINGDHALLSSVLDLTDAPAGKTLRDVMPIHLPDDARGKTWKVWAGLWLLRRGGERVPVVDAGHAIVNDGRVLVVQFVAR